MNRIRIAMGLAMLLAASVASAADAPAPAETAGLRVAVVRLHEVYQNYEYTMEMEKIIEADLEPDRQEVEKVKGEILELKEALRTTRDMDPGDFAWFVKMQEIKRKEYYLEVRRKEISQRINERMATLYRAFWSRFQQAVELYAIKNKYDLVLRASEPELRNEEFVNIQREIALKSVPFYSKSLDRTEQIVQLMNALYRESKKNQNGGN